jgi:hypothetical protein
MPKEHIELLVRDAAWRGGGWGYRQKEPENNLPHDGIGNGEVVMMVAWRMINRVDEKKKTTE